MLHHDHTAVCGGVFVVRGIIKLETVKGWPSDWVRVHMPAGGSNPGKLSHLVHVIPLVSLPHFLSLFKPTVKWRLKMQKYFFFCKEIFGLIVLGLLSSQSPTLMAEYLTRLTCLIWDKMVWGGKCSPTKPQGARKQTHWKSFQESRNIFFSSPKYGCSKVWSV